MSPASRFCLEVWLLRNYSEVMAPPSQILDHPSQTQSLVIISSDSDRRILSQPCHILLVPYARAVIELLSPVGSAPRKPWKTLSKLSESLEPPSLLDWCISLVEMLLLSFRAWFLWPSSLGTSGRGLFLNPDPLPFLMGMVMMHSDRTGTVSSL